MRKKKVPATEARKRFPDKAVVLPREVEHALATLFRRLAKYEGEDYAHHLWAAAQEARNRCVLGILPLLNIEAWRCVCFLSRKCEYDDTLQFGLNFVLERFGSYDPDIGRVSSYFVTVTSRAMVGWLRRRHKVIPLPKNEYDYRRKYEGPHTLPGPPRVSPLEGKLRAVEEVLTGQFGLRTGSLLTGQADGGDNDIGELLCDRSTVPVERALEEAEERAALDESVALLAKFAPRYAEVLRLRYWEGLTLQQAGERLGVTRENVRQLQARAEDVLRRWMGGHATGEEGDDVGTGDSQHRPGAPRGGPGRRGGW